MMHEHHIPVARTARYYVLGARTPALAQIWFVCHGYGQLAGRFLRRFAPLDDGTRLIVAPEGLSRFYVGNASGGSHAHAAVGASWMTREDRLSEIDDYIRYLDAVHAQLLDDPPSPPVELVALGFSQGVATVCRWAARGAARFSRLVLWGGVIPPDLDLDAHAHAFRSADITTVIGDDDELVDRAAVAEQAERLARAGLAYRAMTYPGGHRIDAGALARVALAPAAAPAPRSAAAPPER